MASHEITCATKIYPHRHIAVIGNAQRRWTVTQARAAIKNGADLLHRELRRPAHGEHRAVQLPAAVRGPHASGPSNDRSEDNNLDQLPECT